MSKLDAEPQTNPHPEHVGRFRIKRLLGMGSMGAVFLAEDPVIHREVAIKTLNVNLTAQEARMFEETFLNEARAAGRLNHPHIVTVYDAGRIDGVSYIAMEYLKGVELKELIARGEEFTMKQVAEIFIRVADALQYAHDNGIVHRDIKPANIFLTAKTNPKVLDFGIAQAATSFSQSFMPNPFGKNLVGTPNYMSPELLLGQPLDGRSDIFSLGVVMYEVLTRQVPFRGSTFEDLTRAICTAHPTPPQDINPEVPLPIAKIVAKALAKSPGERYQSARELADDLRRYVATVRVRQIMSATASGAGPDMLEDEAPSSRVGWWIGGAAVIAASIGIGWFALHGRLETPEPSAPATTNAAAPAAGATPDAATAATPVPPPAPSLPTAPLADQTVVPVVAGSAAAKPAAKAEKPHANKREAKKAPAPAPEPVAPPANGSLAIAVSPWGEVLVDGSSRGISPPLSTLTLPAGRHTIEIRNGDFEPMRMTVEVKPNETTRIRHKF